jgi:DNA-binding SARP family transcriptional activator
MLVKQTALPQNGSSLLNYAISRLSPEVFSHPIWVHFGKKEAAISLNMITDLLSMAKNLQERDPSAACQVLLICAFYQNSAGQRFNALRVTQQAHALAERTGLSRETIWALWGECAICVQQGIYEQAASNLAVLQAELIKQNEWIVANLIEVMKQSLRNLVTGSAGQHSASPRDRPFEDLLVLTFDWLQQWGFSADVYESEFEIKSKQSKLTRSLFSIQRWQSRWRSLMRAIRRRLKSLWAENDTPRKKRRFTFPQVKLDSAIEKVNTNHIAGQAFAAMPVAVHMLGPFSLTIGDLIVKLPASRSLSLLKYLLLHHRQSTPREVLMDVFWQDAEPEAARNNLNVALYSLRRALRTSTDLPVIVFENGAYGLAPTLQVWLDVEEFERCIKAAQRLETRDQLTASVTEYEAALSLYQGDFLEHAPYEEWTILERERLRIAYLDTLDHLSQIYFSQERYAGCITVCQLILIRDRCREDAHCLLMRCYSRQGQGHLALRQYQLCVESLRTELEVDPKMETRQLYEQIRCHEYI